MSNNENNVKKNSKSLMTSFLSYVNGDDAKLESNIIDVDKSHENYIKNQEGQETAKFKFFDYTMNTYLILFTLVNIIPLVIIYLFFR